MIGALGEGEHGCSEDVSYLFQAQFNIQQRNREIKILYQSQYYSAYDKNYPFEQ